MLGLNNLPLVVNEYLTVEKSGKKTWTGERSRKKKKLVVACDSCWGCAVYSYLIVKKAGMSVYRLVSSVRIGCSGARKKWLGLESFPI